MPDNDKNVGVYTEHFAANGAAEQYARKFISPLERIRHQHEIDFLAPIVEGDVFDCSIATGRFIGALPKARTYAGMDYSEEFLERIRRRYPAVPVIRGDLRDGIPQPDNRYDVTICLRTLSALGHLKGIVAEMTRVTRPGGLVVFDYGTKACEEILNGVRLAIDSEDPEGAMLAANLEPIERLPLDGLIVRIKRFPRVFWVLDHASKPAWIKYLFSYAERLATRFWRHRILYVGRVRK